MKQLIRLLIIGMLAGTAWAGVDINTATQSELESVKGLGPAKARAIIDYRTKNGNFRSVDELDNVKGFGKASIARLRAELTVSGSRASSRSDPASGKD